jgi:hypothetical protein
MSGAAARIYKISPKVKKMSDLKFTKLHDDAVIPTSDKWEYGLLMRAYLMSETGRPSKSLIPPQSTRFITTGITIDEVEQVPLFIYTCHDLVARSIFVVPGFLNFDKGVDLRIGLYNGSHQSYYVCHDDPIARLVVK